MSLYEEADGLLGTHVTWQDIEDEMRKALGTKARFGENKKETNISDMKGFLSRIALVEPDWTDVEPSENLPQKFVVKISSPLALLAMAEVMQIGEEATGEEKMKVFSGLVRMLHNREVATYALLLKHNVSNIPLTKIYALRGFTEENTLKGFIISEYFENLSHISIYETIDIEDLLPIVRSVAAFSAIGETVTKEELSFAAGTNLRTSLWERYSDETILDGVFDKMRGAFPKEYKEKLDGLVKIYKYYMDQKTIAKYEKVPDIIGHKGVLIHGDLWAANFLCVRNNEHLDFRAIIDWQTVSIGSPGLDVGLLFVSTLNTKDRREKVDFLLEQYYTSFVDNLQGRPAPYTLEQLRQNYQLLFPIMTFMVVMSIVPHLENSQVSEEALDKMIGMMEDVLVTHEKNLKDFPEFYRD